MLNTTTYTVDFDLEQTIMLHSVSFSGPSDLKLTSSLKGDIEKAILGALEAYTPAPAPITLDSVLEAPEAAPEAPAPEAAPVAPITRNRENGHGKVAFLGVSLNKKKGLYEARKMVPDGKYILCGYFDNAALAAIAYDLVAYFICDKPLETLNLSKFSQLNLPIDSYADPLFDELANGDHDLTTRKGRKKFRELIGKLVRQIVKSQY